MTAGESRALLLSRAEKVRIVALTVAWMGMFLTGIDVAINQLFRIPADPRTRPSAMAQYFDYGRSIEGKLARSVGPDEASSAPIIAAGWIEPAMWANKPESPEGKISVGVYGMSFAVSIAEAMVRSDPGVSARLIAGPSAPPNWCFAAFKADPARASLQVAVLAVLGTSVARMPSLTGLNWTFEAPAPYTFPRYMVNEAGTLQEVKPLISNDAEFREVFRANAARWAAFRQQLREWDEFFDPLIFDATPLDSSVIVRLLRRGYAAHQGQRVEERILGRDGFRETNESIRTLRELAVQFARICRESRTVPVLLLLHNAGMEDYVYRVLADEIRTRDIPYVSTHEIISSRDPRNFEADGHFRPEAVVRIAERLRAVIRERLGR